MLLEKAWAKVKGNYEMVDGGFVENGLRSLVGCPVFSYSTAGLIADETFTVLAAANNSNYIMGADTRGGNDSTLNECGIPMGHAYSLISAFYLKTGSTIDHKVYMIRNPWGTTNFNQSLNY